MLYTPAKFLSEDNVLLSWLLNCSLALVLQKFYLKFSTESTNVALTSWLWV